jgi:hypothetical protein
MKHFQSVEQLSTAFVGGALGIEPNVSIADFNFHYDISSKTNIIESMQGKRPFIVYTCESTNAQLVFFWTVHKATLTPAGVILTDSILSKTQDMIVEMNGEMITIKPDQLIGDTAFIKFTSLQNPKEIKGKVDTGATVSSLHADHYQVNGNTITFTCQPLGSNSITMPLKTKHAVSSPDGGTQYRPVVELNVKVNGKLINNVLFNLNDRGHMEHPVLIGQNLLQAGKFYVDPSMKEHVETDLGKIEELVEQIDNIQTDQEIVAELYEKMLSSNIAFGDLVRYIKQQVTSADFEY